MKARLLFTPITVVMVALILFVASAKANPLEELKQARQHQDGLLVRGPAGWSLVRDVPRYQWLERRAAAAWHTITWNPFWAIRWVFGPRWPGAWNVALCEGGRPMPSPRAQNGQYLGIFQMGSSERRLYGHGPSPLAQARAAFLYSSGGRNWSAWACRP